MVVALWNLAAKKLAIEMGAKLINTLTLTGEFKFENTLKINTFTLTGEFEFESYDHFRKCYEDFMNAGFDNVQFFNTHGATLKHEIKMHLSNISEKFMEAVDMLNRHVEREGFDWGNWNYTEDLYHDVTFTLRILGHM